MCGADLSDLDEPIAEGKRGSCSTNQATKKNPDESRELDEIQ
jgi:hypothetical protein